MHLSKCQTCAHNECLDTDLIVIVDYEGFSDAGCELNIPGYPNLDKCVHWFQFPEDGE